MTRQTAVALAIVLSLVACKTSMKRAPDMTLGKDIEQRARLEEFATYGDHPELLPGQIIVIKQSKDGTCPEGRVFKADGLSVDSFLQEGKKVEPKTLSNVLYQGAIKRGDKFNVVVATFSEDLKASYGVEVIATDIREAVGEPLLDMAKVHALEAKPMPPDVCARVLVKNVRVSLVHWKSYGEATSGTQFTGTAFGFGNEIFSTESYFQPKVLVFLDIKWLESSAKPGILEEPHPGIPAEHITITLPKGDKQLERLEAGTY